MSPFLINYISRLIAHQHSVPQFGCKKKTVHRITSPYCDFVVMMIKTTKYPVGAPRAAINASLAKECGARQEDAYRAERARPPQCLLLISDHSSQIAEHDSISLECFNLSRFVVYSANLHLSQLNFPSQQ